MIDNLAHIRKAQDFHVQRRALERWGMEIGRRGIARMAAAIEEENGDAVWVYSYSRRFACWLVWCGQYERWVPVVYDHGKHLVKTVLPAEGEVRGFLMNAFDAYERIVRFGARANAM